MNNTLRIELNNKLNKNIANLNKLCDELNMKIIKPVNNNFENTDTSTKSMEITTKKSFLPKFLLKHIVKKYKGTCLTSTINFFDNFKNKNISEIINDNTYFDNFYVECKNIESRLNLSIFTMEKNMILFGFYCVPIIAFSIPFYWLGQIPTLIGGTICTYTILNTDSNKFLYTDDNFADFYCDILKSKIVDNYEKNELQCEYYIISMNPGKLSGHAIGIMVYPDNEMFTYDVNFGIFKGDISNELKLYYEENNLIEKNSKITKHKIMFNN